MQRALTRRDIEHYEEKLRSEYADLTSGLERRGEGDVRPDEQADEGVVAEQRDTDHRLAGHRAHALDEVEAALERLEAGTFGRCESCGGWIARERLEVLPRANLCAACESRSG